MKTDYSKEALLGFLDYLASKGLMKKSSASSRKTAANNVLSVLDENEASDLRVADLDVVMLRFENIHSGKYTPESLRIYKSRTSSSLQDFFRYKSNPANFKMTTSSIRPTHSGKESARESQQKSNQTKTFQTTPSPILSDISTIDIPIPVRTGYIVQVNGIPTNISIAEATKISNVVLAMAVTDQE